MNCAINQLVNEIKYTKRFLYWKTYTANQSLYGVTLAMYFCINQSINSFSQKNMTDSINEFIIHINLFFIILNKWKIWNNKNFKHIIGAHIVFFQTPNFYNEIVCISVQNSTEKITIKEYKRSSAYSEHIHVCSCVHSVHIHVTFQEFLTFWPIGWVGPFWVEGVVKFCNI